MAFLDFELGGSAGVKNDVSGVWGVSGQLAAIVTDGALNPKAEVEHAVCSSGTLAIALASGKLPPVGTLGIMGAILVTGGPE